VNSIQEKAFAQARTATTEAKALIAECEGALKDRSNPASGNTILYCSTVAGLKMQFANMVLRLAEFET
jgi:hypothetical protein